MRNIIAVGLLITLLNACNTKSEEEKFALSYCGGCHVMPTPDLLDKKTWKGGVLHQTSIPFLLLVYIHLPSQQKLENV